MSNLAITVEEVADIEPHPHADRLEIVKILGTQCCEPIGKYHVGERVFYFPPNMLISPEWAEKLGVQQYLKHAWWGDQKVQCRVAGCRLRGIPSYGFISGGVMTGDIGIDVGTDVSYIFDGKKYEPPLPPGDQALGHDDFECYTDIANYWQYPDAFSEGMRVRVTEKLHGTNSRVGVVWIDGEWQFIAGSHSVCWEPPSRYWKPLAMAHVLRLINFLCDEKYPVTVYGEIYGPGIQDMDYGLAHAGYRVFDIKVNGRFLHYDDLVDACDFWQVDMVPLLYKGMYYDGLVEEYTNGNSLAAIEPVRSKFKGREGIVITPLMEEWSEQLLGRLILKSLSADYLDRKGAQDNG
jgi:RNA ligase (TIGR02306 family)